MIDVVWLSYRKDRPHRGYWDYNFLEKIFAHEVGNIGYQFRHHEHIKGLEGAVIVIPGQHHHEYIDQLNEEIKQLKWCVIIVAGDEDRLFPTDKIKHPNMKLYVMTPHEAKEDKADYRMGEGFPPDTKLVENYRQEYFTKPLDWFFSGQITQVRREKAVQVLRKLDNGYLHETKGFTQGLEHDEYYRLMAQAKVIPCVGGICTPDTFRLFEALEAGCVPVVDKYSAKENENDYWKYIFGDHPLPVIEDWQDFPAKLEEILADYPAINNRIFSWWQQKKRSIVLRLQKDIEEVSGIEPEKYPITTVMTTSPIKAHPSTEIIEETIASVKDQVHGEIILLIDGVREEQQDRQADYQEYIKRLLWLCNYKYKNVLPIVFEGHHHQSGMIRKVLPYIQSPQLLFVEHDFPLDGEIPWQPILELLTDGELDTVRFYLEPFLQPLHNHLFYELEPIEMNGLPMVRTGQWSQRPHISNTDYYRKIIDKYTTDTSRTMIEDAVYGEMHSDFIKNKKKWHKNKIAIYHPDGIITRCRNLDGRGDDPKYEMEL